MKTGQESQVALQIDSHQHFWSYQAAEYPWMSEKQGALKVDYLPDDLIHS